MPADPVSDPRPDLRGARIAILATDGVEQSEITKPLAALRDAGAEAIVVSPKTGEIQAYDHLDPARAIPVDKTVFETDASAYHGLVLPGGVINPDQLRLEPQAIAFVRAFVEADKPIAAVCHGPWTLIDAGGVAGKRMTSWPSLRMDLTNAGADWVDEEVVVDGQLVTSRKPDDLPAFCARMLDLIAEAGPFASTSH